MLILEGEQVADVWPVDARGWDNAATARDRSPAGIAREAL
jgi:hypothetical protein